MNKIYSIIAIMLLSVSAIFAQVPNAINFQAIARGADGEVMSNMPIQIRLTVLDGSATGTEVYQELRALTTNEFGSFAFQIGTDAEYVTAGSFDAIAWETGKKFLKLDYDPTNQFDWSLTLGTIEFATVPFAFSAGSISYIDITGVKDGDALIYNSTLGKFEPGQLTLTDLSTVATSGNYEDLLNLPTIPTKLSDFTDINTTGAISGQVLSFDGTNWSPSSVSNSGTTLWTENGSNISFNSGNVGIGIPNPTYKLEVSGDIISTTDAGTTWGDAGAFYLGNPNHGIRRIPGTNQIEIITSGSLPGDARGKIFLNAALDKETPQVTLDYSGNFGVGTTEPTSKFQVVGLPEYTSNELAKTAGLTVGAFYRNGDDLKVVH